jgi:putative sigma-54 modulation protein
MRLALTGRQVEITPDIRRLVAQKMARLERLLDARAVSGQVELRMEKFRHVVELHVHARGGHMLQARATATAWDEALSEAVDRLAAQAQKLKTKWEGRKREARAVKRTLAPEPEPVARPARRVVKAAEPAGPRVIRARGYAVRSMTVEDAGAALVMTAESFVVFRNLATDAIGVLFRRKDGDLGLIEPEV